MDEGHRLTELVLRETEADVTQVYRKATDEVQKKLDDYLRRFKVKDENKRSLLKEGKITQDEYDYWRTGQIMVGKRWEEMKNTLAQDLHNYNNLARSIVNGHMPEVYAINHNYGTFQVEKGSMVNTSYTLYDRHTVERIIRDQPDLLPLPGEQMKQTFKDFDAYKRGEEVKGLSDKTRKAFDRYIASNKDIRWQKGQIQSVTLQSILQGESIPNMARRIAREMGEINRNASIRYARTATTGAENAGRVDAYKRAKDMGIDMEQEWIATLDKRTRHSHRQLDGERAQVGEKFSNGCRFPGDPEGPASEIWNCRCTTGAVVSGWEDISGKFRSDKALEGMTYDEWRNEHQKYEVEVPTVQSRIGKAGTVDEVNKIMNSQGWFRTNRAGVTSEADLTGTDLESAKSIAASYQQVFEKYPKLVGKLDAPDAQPIGMNSSTYAWCYIRDNGKVQVNPNYYKSWNIIVSAYENNVSSNWHPEGTTAESIVTHEIGHAIDGLLAKEGVLGGYTASGEFRYASSSLKTTIMNRAAKADPTIEYFMAVDKRWHSTEAVSGFVSRYATKNSQEWFAECFAEYITSASPRTVASEFGKELERLVNKLP